MSGCSHHLHMVIHLSHRIINMRLLCVIRLGFALPHVKGDVLTMVVRMVSLVYNAHKSGQYTSQTLHPNGTTSYYIVGEKQYVKYILCLIS